MAEVPSDVRYPPGNAVDFDDIFNRLLALKVQHFPEHTARDLADPYIQLLVLVASLGQHSFGRLNHALRQLSPVTATSRKALVSYLPIVNRPLDPILPSRGPIYAKLKLAQSSGTVLVQTDQKIAPSDTIDPIFTFDEEVSVPTADTFQAFHHDNSSGTTTDLGSGPYSSFSWDINDSLIIAFETLGFDGFDLVFSTAFSAADGGFSVEFFNEERGNVDSVTNLGSTLQFNLNTYMFSTLVSGSLPDGLSVTIRHKPSGIEETVSTTITSDVLAVTSFLGQSPPSISASDYEVLAVWRPIASVIDNTSGFSVDGEWQLPITSLLSEDALWAEDITGLRKIRIRLVSAGSLALPSTLDINTLSSGNRSQYVISDITQGVRANASIGQADGTALQFLPVQDSPINEPVIEPAVGLEVGTDADWIVVDDFSNSDPTSKHAVFKEDPDAGFGIQFGDGTIGILPPQGDAVKVTFRTQSLQPGDLDPLAAIRNIGGVGLLDNFTLFRGTEGYAEPEASTLEGVARFQVSVLPQLALRAESAITSPEIVTAMSGGAPNRATFKTTDGRTPFSRASFTLEGAGSRQYRVIVVGSESDPDGAVAATDLVEGAAYLNGGVVGIEVIEGHGPQNTQAILDEFVPRVLLPTITITISGQIGIREQIDQINRAFFQPHSRDEDGKYRWEFGGKVPIAVLFALIWAAVPDRQNLNISVADGLTTLDVGSTVDLTTFELPTLDPTYDPLVNIILVDPNA